MNRRPMNRKCLGTLAVLTLSCASALQASSLPRVRVLATGGTIAGAQSSAQALSYKSGSVSVEELIKTIPQVAKIADVSSEQVCNVGSQTMNNTIWLQLAKRLSDVLQDSTVDAVVITHGTDTLEETAYFLSLISKSDKPIVMVGAMRPSTALGADGPLNLYNAIALAANPEARGRSVLVVLNDEIHYAREVQKSDTTQLDTFVSPNRGRAGLIHLGHAVFFSPLVRRYGLQSEFSLEGLTQLPSVEIVYSYANLGRDVIDYLVRAGAKGIVLAGMGEGNTTDEALAGLRDAVKHGVTVVRSRRVASGNVRRDIEVDDDHLGFIAAGELNPQKARVLLMLGLTKTQDVHKLQSYFDEY